MVVLRDAPDGNRKHARRVLLPSRGIINSDCPAHRQQEKGQRRRKWLSPDKAAKRVAETELAELICDFAGALQAAA